MKNGFFWDIKTQFVSYKRYITSPLKTKPVNIVYDLRYSRLWQWRMPFSVIWQCGSCKNRHFKGERRLHHHGGKNRWPTTTLAVTSNDVCCEEIVSRTVRVIILFLRSALRLLVTANVPSSPILVTLMKEALGFSETSVLPRRRHSTHAYM
jgi:hypothetical protein